MKIEQLSAENTLMKNLLAFIAGELEKSINRCKSADLNRDGTKDERLVNIAGYCVELKGKIAKEKQKLVQKS